MRYLLPLCVCLMCFVAVSLGAPPPISSESKTAAEGSSSSSSSSDNNAGLDADNTDDVIIDEWDSLDQPQATPPAVLGLDLSGALPVRAGVP